MPRFDRFEARARCSNAKQPRLFAFPADIAAKTDRDASEVTCSRSTPGPPSAGLMGPGSRRVMGIGLLLLQMLAEPLRRRRHELGTTRRRHLPGAWVHKTRRRQHWNLPEGLFRLPFLLYANVFFRVMGAISREQERAADALACR